MMIVAYQLNHAVIAIFGDIQHIVAMTTAFLQYAKIAVVNGYANDTHNFIGGAMTCGGVIAWCNIIREKCYETDILRAQLHSTTRTTDLIEKHCQKVDVCYNSAIIIHKHYITSKN